VLRATAIAIGACHVSGGVAFPSMTRDIALSGILMGIVAFSASFARGDSFVPTRPSFPVTLPKLSRPKQPLASHHVEDPNPLTVKAIKDPARRLDDLPVAGTAELGRYGTAFGVPFQLFDMFEDSLDQTARGLGVVESDIICDRVKVGQRRLGPDYLSHRAMRFFASE